MKRREFVKGIVGAGIAVAVGGQSVLAEATPTSDEELVVESRWETTNIGNDFLEVFETKITALPDEEDMQWSLDRLLEFEEKAKDGDIRGELIGYDVAEREDTSQYWQALFVEYRTPYIATQRAYAHCGNLYFEFRWQFIHSGDTDGYRVFREVMNRAMSTSDLDELEALLPTQEEFDVIGTYEQVV